MTSRIEREPVRRSIPNPLSCRRGKADAEGAEVVVVDFGHGFGVFIGDLGLEAPLLVEGVVEQAGGVVAPQLQGGAELAEFIAFVGDFAKNVVDVERGDLDGLEQLLAGDQLRQGGRDATVRLGSEGLKRG